MDNLCAETNLHFYQEDWLRCGRRGRTAPRRPVRSWSPPAYCWAWPSAGRRRQRAGSGHQWSPLVREISSNCRWLPAGPGPRLGAGQFVWPARRISVHRRRRRRRHRVLLRHHRHAHRDRRLRYVGASLHQQRISKIHRWKPRHKSCVLILHNYNFLLLCCWLFEAAGVGVVVVVEFFDIT